MSHQLAWSTQLAGIIWATFIACMHVNTSFLAACHVGISANLYSLPTGTVLAFTADYSGCMGVCTCCPQVLKADPLPWPSQSLGASTTPQQDPWLLLLLPLLQLWGLHSPRVQQQQLACLQHLLPRAA